MVHPYNSTFQSLTVEFTPPSPPPQRSSSGRKSSSRTSHAVASHRPVVGVGCDSGSVTPSATFLLVEDLRELHPCMGPFPPDFAGHAGAKEDEFEFLHQNASGRGWKNVWMGLDMTGYEVGFIFLVSPKGHQVYTLTNIKKGTLYTLTKNSNINPASYDFSRYH